MTSESLHIFQHSLRLAQELSRIRKDECGFEKALPIKMHIQTPGGQLTPTLYIMDLIIDSDVPIHSYIDGYCASAGTLLSVVAHRRFMTKHSLMLIHQSALTEPTGEHKYEEIKDVFDRVDTMMLINQEIYLKFTAIQNSEDLENILRRDVWFDAEKCLELRLVDEII
jgi:ATP-dependent protease ClpP protease subunit